MHRSIRTLTAVAVALVALAVATSAVEAQESAPAASDAAAAQPPLDPDTVVAKVGDETVTEGEVAIARDAFASELANVPEAQKRSALIDAMISMELLAKGAHDEGLDQGPKFESELAFLKLQAMRNSYVEHAIVNGITDAELQEGYQTLVVTPHKPEEQVHARHILVETKEQAEKIIADLKGGAAFEELAKQSKDGNGQNGGDLGFFGKGQMVPEFETAAFALEPGTFTQEPVQTQFGWHVIKVEEKRMSAPPAFDDVKEQLRSYMLREKFDSVLTALRDKYPVEIVDPMAGPAAQEAPADAQPKN